MTEPTLKFHDGHAIPHFGIGVWQVPGDETAGIVEAAIKQGTRLIDGAKIYGNETEMGEGIRRGGVARDELFVTSKLWNDDQGYDSTLKAFDGTMERLGLDVLDLYLIHWPCPDRDAYVDTWKAMIELKKSGRVRSIGVSNFTADHIDRVVSETGEVPVLNQIELHPQLQQAEMRRAHEGREIVTQSYSPLGGGTLFDAPTVMQIAEKHGKTPAQVLLRWNMQLGNGVITRSTKPERLEQAREVLAFTLPEEDMEALAGLDADARQGAHPSEMN
ncbi:aldo/keto reductase [Pseudoroseicyclus aestuarii]|uniref:Diketogulonate reductase-like aldo/keto reductase n=1 Tax=Pseudoroseicyclus aestuarii TaxID=1795041 RepID=A0A318SPI2_9RHOB|nr:aldo/keto reductase [Pseudoroseicyclus aestuarii]PYE83780.1 diketogulonate reductase-like aldo/keto reductase [Pseudoroseicyclus aestuarii]